MTAVIIILAIAAVFLAVILIRTALFVPKDEPRPSAEAVDFGREAAESALAALVRCRTVSCADRSLEDDGEFEKLIALLPDRALLFCRKGRGECEPAVLMAHYDVAPAVSAAAGTGSRPGGRSWR